MRRVARCVCQATEIKIRSVLGSAHCHCKACRNAHGAPFVTWVAVAYSDLQFTRGEDRVQWFRATTVSQRGFCRICGTTVIVDSTLTPDRRFVPRGILEVEVGAEKHQPVEESFAIEQRVAWGDGAAANERRSDSLDVDTAPPFAPLEFSPS